MGTDVRVSYLGFVTGAVLMTPGAVTHQVRRAVCTPPLGADPRLVQSRPALPGFGCLRSAPRLVEPAASPKPWHRRPWRVRRGEHGLGLESPSGVCGAVPKREAQSAALSGQLPPSPAPHSSPSSSKHTILQLNMNQRGIKLVVAKNENGVVTLIMPPPGGLIAQPGW
jgi:hypothetical protein